MTYEYCCTDVSCQHTWEAEQKITENALVTCPKCGRYTAKRLISGGVSRNAILKGSGWYGTGGY